MIFLELTAGETVASFLLWIFLIGVLMLTIGMSGVVNFRLREVKHGRPFFSRGKHRAQPQLVARSVQSVRSRAGRD